MPIIVDKEDNPLGEDVDKMTGSRMSSFTPNDPGLTAGDNQIQMAALTIQEAFKTCREQEGEER